MTYSGCQLLNSTCICVNSTIKSFGWRIPNSCYLINDQQQTSVSVAEWISRLGGLESIILSTVCGTISTTSRRGGTTTPLAQTPTRAVSNLVTSILLVHAVHTNIPHSSTIVTSYTTSSTVLRSHSTPKTTTTLSYPDSGDFGVGKATKGGIAAGISVGVGAVLTIITISPAVERYRFLTSQMMTYLSTSRDSKADPRAT
jgi:hypothetical protein